MLNFISILNLCVTFGLTAGGIVAFRHGFNRAANEIQDRVIKALQSEIGSLQDRIVALEKENTRLSHVIMTIRAALKRRGLHITIDGDLVSIHDRSGNLTQTSRIRGSQPPSGGDDPDMEA
ncbi:MAG TPA: hypothetical protein VFA09_22025 [Ktedonobacteraceae bacterium]|nr:hypothetical protein [Ktedonobacteraceae bacterium]